MHPPPADHVHSLRTDGLGGVLLVVLLALGGLGCATEPPTPQLLGPDDALFTASETERRAALAVLDSLQQGVITTAFDRLPGYAFSHRVHAAQRTPDGALTAQRTEVLRFPPSDSASRPLRVRLDSAGAFDAGWMGGFSSAPSEQPVNRAQYVLPDDAAYLAPRTREAFRYRLRPDTALGGRRVRVVEVRAQPGELGADRAVRHARLFVEPATYELVGLYLVRADASLLFREDSRAFTALHPAPDSGWVPGRTTLDVRLKIPFRAPRQFHLDAAFSAYRPLP